MRLVEDLLYLHLSVITELEADENYLAKFRAQFFCTCCALLTVDAILAISLLNISITQLYILLGTSVLDFSYFPFPLPANFIPDI